MGMGGHPIHTVLRPATGVKAQFYKVKIRVKGLQSVDVQNVELVQCRGTFFTDLQGRYHCKSALKRLRDDGL